VGVPDDTWGEVGVAFVVRAPGCAVDAAGLSAHLLERLSKFKVPKSFEFVDALPRTPYGKVLKDALRAAYLDARSHPSTLGTSQEAGRGPRPPEVES
jgi:acyl-CoA synthetase (AMP-forming)/AMP-acid ligase II